MPKRQLIGRVKSDRMKKTVVVEVERFRIHPAYQKRIKRRKSYKAQNELEAKIGDTVRIEEGRPISKEKRFKVIEIVEKKES